MRAAPRVEQGADLPWHLLTVNARIAGGARFTFDPRAGRPALGIDLHIAAQAPVSRAVPDACAALLLACSALSCDPTNVPPRARSSRADITGRGRIPAEGIAAGGSPKVNAQPQLSDAMLDLLREAEWPYPEPLAGRGAINLGVRDATYGATIEEHPLGASFRTEIIAPEGIAPTSREAIGVLLLQATDSFRLVRAAATESEDGRHAVHLAASLPREPQAGDLAAALGCLAAACEQLGREANALLSESLATTYLEMQGRHRVPLEEVAPHEELETTLHGG